MWRRREARIPIGGRRRTILKVARLALSVSPPASFPFVASAQEKDARVEYPTFYRTIENDGISIFYREVGPRDAPPLLLLHGFPSSSRMYQPLFARLGDRYRLVAPDYPGFGHSDWPDPRTFAYTFDRISGIMNALTEGASRVHRARLHDLAASLHLQIQRRDHVRSEQGQRSGLPQEGGL